MIFAITNSVQAQDEISETSEVSETSEISEISKISETEVKIKYFKHEVSLYGAGGMSVLNYKLANNGSKTDGAGGISGIIGASYTWFINKRFGISSGVEMTSYGAKTTYDSFSQEGKDYGTGYSKFNFSYSITNFVEEQGVTMVSVPILLQYNALLSNTVGFYALGGLKIGVPVYTKARMFPSHLSTKGWYYYENQWYDGANPNNEYKNFDKLGFVNYNNPRISSEIDLKTSFMASIEAGARVSLTDNLMLYIGAYLDCGLNNIRSTSDRQIVTYRRINSTAAELGYASVLNSSFVDKTKIFGAGFKLKFSFGWSEITKN
jgi:hypothetical protein